MATGSKCPKCGAAGPYREPPCGCVLSLFEEPKKDNFEHESPLRAFATFNSLGLYAIGKGFRPSLQHLPVYLDAMERKEGWRLVQVLEATSQTPSFVFRHDGRVPSPERTVGVSKALGAPYEAPPAWAKQGSDELIPEDRHEEALLFILERSGVGPQGGQEVIEAYREFLKKDDVRLHRNLFTRLHLFLPDMPEVRLKQRIDAYRVHVGQGDPYKAFANMVLTPTTADAPKDDPINPKHYGGTACAEIGELLTANSYQVLKYNWRLGEKDDEKIELGKAIWYLNREIVLADTADLPARMLPEQAWFDERLRHANRHAQAVARILISWNRHGNIHSLRGLRKQLQRTLRELEAKSADRGRGLEP